MSTRDDHEGAVLDDTPRVDSGEMAEEEEVLGKISDETYGLARYVVVIFACLIYSYCFALFWCSFAHDFSILEFNAELKICYNYIYAYFSLSLLNVLLCYLHITH